MVFMQTDNGSSFASDKSFSQRVSKWFKQAGITGITAHSIRKHLATKMAENGATEFELMAWFGWGDPKEARPYITKANRKKMSKSAGAKRVSGTGPELNVERASIKAKKMNDFNHIAKRWRPHPESNRGGRICNPLRNHSAMRPHSVVTVSASISYACKN